MICTCQESSFDFSQLLQNENTQNVSELRFFSPLESMQVTIILHSLLYSINTIKAYNFLGTGGTMEARQAKILLFGT